jgi:NADP-dependent 3-hydroxy acid dehydrogenase YdfG
MSDPQEQGRVAVITGASSGIGAATARALAGDGSRVALLARRVDRITALAEEIGNGAIAITADVTDRDALLAAADRVQQDLGGADVLVNSAGIMLLGPFSSDQRDDYRRMLEVNLLGAITTTEVFLDQLKTGGGDVVNISSVAGRSHERATGCTRQPNGASTGGRNPCARSSCQTSGSPSSSPAPSPPNIEPGAVATELPTHITHEATRQGAEQLYSQVAVTAEDIAEVIAFAVNRPRHLAIHEILLRPANQEL